jgi:phage FluMu gp28-like protein
VETSGQARVADPVQTINRLREVLPAAEWEAVRAWLTTFYPYQLRWLLDWNRFALVLKARQIGASFAFAAAAALWSLLGETTTIISKGERESSWVLKSAAKHLDVLRDLGSAWAKTVKRSAQELTVSSGGILLALPATSGGRGYSGNVILDEFAYHADPQAVWDGAAAVAMHGYKMRVMSTPNGVGNLFHKLCTDPNANRGYSKHKVSLEEARADGLNVTDETCWSLAHGDSRIFEQLFHCSFLDGDMQYLPTALVQGAIDYDMAPIPGVPYAGLDIGLENDLTSLTVVKLDKKGHVWEQETRTCKRTSWEDQQAMILASYHDWEWRRLCVDATGMGAVPSQLLQKALGRHRVIPIDFTLQSKEMLATGMYQRFAGKTVHISNDEQLVHDVCALRRIVTSSGNVRYDAPRTRDGHADRAWSLALALHACSPLSQLGGRKELGPGDYAQQ